MPTGTSRRRPSKNIMPRGKDADAFDGLAALVGHASRDGAHARQREVDLFERLPVSDLYRPAHLARPPLPVIEPQVSAARHRHPIARRRQVLELVTAIQIGAGRALSFGSELGRPDRDSRAAERLAALASHDASLEHCRAFDLFRPGIARGRRPLLNGLNRRKARAVPACVATATVSDSPRPAAMQVIAGDVMSGS